MNILLVDIGGYFNINNHKLLVVITGYYINGYWWLLYYKLLLDILGYIIIGYW
jgi:hypothetical protein